MTMVCGVAVVRVAAVVSSGPLVTHYDQSSGLTLLSDA